MQDKEFKAWRVWVLEIINWLVRGIGRGLYKALPYLLLIGIVCFLVLVLDPISSCKERDIRGIGLVLQIAGFGMVAWQLTDLRGLFDKPSFSSQVVSYLKTFPSRYVKTVNVRVQISAGTPTVSARLRVKAGPNAPLKRRVEVLEKTVESVEGELRTIRDTLNRHKTDNKKALAEVREEIGSRVTVIKELIDDALIGGMHFDWVGITSFVMGIGLATVAPEISVGLGYGSSCSQ